MTDCNVIELNVPTNDLEWLYIPDVVYAEYGACKRHLQLIVPYRPQWGNEKYPLIVYVPGSAWYKQELYNKIPALGQLARRGFAIAEVEYRESTIASFPAQVQDTKAAVRFMRSKANDFHIDPEKVILFGDSSGAHTVLLAGMTENVKEFDPDLYTEYSSSVNGIIDFSGPTDLLIGRDEFLQQKSFGEDCLPADDLFGGVDICTVPERAMKASCGLYIDKSVLIPPVLIVHGTEDDIVSINQSVLLFNKLKEENKSVAFYKLQGAKHGGAMFWCEEVMKVMEEFIVKVCDNNHTENMKSSGAL